MFRSRLVICLAAGVGLAAALSGCFLQREEGQERTILKKGWQVSDDMKGWVALPHSEPKEHAGADQGFTYYRLATHNVVPPALDGYWALSPALFRKVAGIELKALDTPKTEMWEMRPGRRVPKDKDGWIGLPVKYPKCEKQGKDAGLALLGADQLIPKEMDGWAAIDRETMAKLVSAREMKGGTLPPKKKSGK